MSTPTEIDFAIIKMGDGAEPEVFKILCGIQDVTINETANTQDRFVRDCTKPGEVPYRKSKLTGRQLDVSGTGLTDTVSLPSVRAALGNLGNFKIELYRDDGTDAGVLLGTYTGEFRMTAANINAPRDNTSSFQVNLISNGSWSYADAPGS
jgi:predicted secreted protein